MQSIFRPASRRQRLWQNTKGDRRDGGLKMGWTKPGPARGLWVLIAGSISDEDLKRWEVMSAWDVWVGRAASRELSRRMEMRSVPGDNFGLSHVATLLLTLGPAKLGRRNLICIEKPSPSSRGIRDSPLPV